jgi:hypothetical protein
MPVPKIQRLLFVAFVTIATDNGDYHTGAGTDRYSAVLLPSVEICQPHMRLLSFMKTRLTNQVPDKITLARNVTGSTVKSL